ncbi:MAG: 6-hydroxycyclohex-1-ene-1-carbonyl-CoA dehydrogenase [Deltaproteobacteria bacterium]|nr:6-hydroxycyclohex-1-ene-1-carbonyl-CoA dehydrogenase [Deltaproteobacteria bacterium]
MGFVSEAWVLEAAKSPLVRKQIELPDPADDRAIVEVSACGLCHTDLGFADGSVMPKKGIPIVLGHEIVGKVVAAGGAGKHLIGKNVLVPAVLPCGSCVFCRAGRGNACPKQEMPGNDVHGGFATHVDVRSAPLVPLDGAPEGFDLREISVVADAVSTAYQAIVRADVREGDLAVVVGAGGVGGFAVQIARALGARVVAIDVDRGRLDLIEKHGASALYQIDKAKPFKDLRKDVQKVMAGFGVASLRHRIFECSGTAPGQQLAFSLIGSGATMVQVGYCRDPIEVRLSNLMAFDATVHGSWGAPVEIYPDCLRLVFERKVALTPFIQHAPMSRIDALFDDMAHHRLERRAVLDPRA